MSRNEERENPLLDFTCEERFLLKKALSRLSVYDDTPRGLCERLCKLQYKKAPVARESCVKVVRFLHAEGLLNERSYAQNLVSALKSRGYGTRRILGELSARKFSRCVLESVREDCAAEEEEEAERAFSMLQRRADARRSDLTDAKEKNRLYGYLARLGFSPELSKQALERLICNEENEEEL